jgi:maltooligosyltrehalose trehalohydrolase
MASAESAGGDERWLARWRSKCSATSANGFAGVRAGAGLAGAAGAGLAAGAAGAAGRAMAAGLAGAGSSVATSAASAGVL